MIVPFRQPVTVAPKCDEADWEALAVWLLESDEMTITSGANGTSVTIGDEERLVPEWLEYPLAVAFESSWGSA